MNAGNRTNIDPFALNFIFRSSGGIKTFRFAIIRKTKNCRQIGNAKPTADTHILVDPGRFRHDYSSLNGSGILVVARYCAFTLSSFLQSIFAATALSS